MRIESAIKEMACGFWPGQSQGQSRSAAVEAEMRPKINARPRQSCHRGLSVAESSERKKLLFCICGTPVILTRRAWPPSPISPDAPNRVRFFHKNLLLEELTAILSIQQALH
jgi:hypothetical protein